MNFPFSLRFHLSKINILIKLSKFNLAKISSTTHINDPLSWEASGFSQNGEDGIINFLHNQLINKKNYFFIEIGSSDGSENNSTLLALQNRWSGICVEADHDRFIYLRYFLFKINRKVISVHKKVNQYNISEILKLCPFKDPDFLSIDIDSIDFYVLKSILKLGFCPKIIAVEYNSFFGPFANKTVKYNEKISYRTKNKNYYGASLEAFKKLLDGYQYKFCCTESAGVNAFFIRKKEFSKFFLEKLLPGFWRKNVYDSS